VERGRSRGEVPFRGAGGTSELARIADADTHQIAVRFPRKLDEAATAADDERLCNIFRFNAYARVAYGQLQEVLACLTVLATCN
jgi:hypothetical protein